MNIKKWWNDGAEYIRFDKDGPMYSLTNGERLTFVAVIVTAACLMSALVASLLIYIWR